MREVIQELSNINGVLCVESLLDLVRSGGQGPADSIASFLIRTYSDRSFESLPKRRLTTRRMPPAVARIRRPVPGLKLPPLVRDRAIAVLDRVSTVARQKPAHRHIG
jgi:hypothetical protein